MYYVLLTCICLHYLWGAGGRNWGTSIQDRTVWASVGRWFPYLQRKMQGCGALLGFQFMVAMAAHQATSTASFVSLHRAPRISCPVTWEREEAKPRIRQGRQTLTAQSCKRAREQRGHLCLENGYRLHRGMGMAAEA